MQKLLIHLAVALGLWFGLKLLGLPVGWRLATLVAGAFLVHLIWERLFRNPFLYLGARPIDPDDPLMLSAKKQAAETFEKMRSLYAKHQNDTCVRFGLKVNSGKIERVCGDLLELQGDTAKVFLRTAPVEEADIKDRAMTISVSDIDDWQIEFRDGTLRGGFTNRAMFKIFQREEGHMPKEFIEQLQRFKEV